MEMNKTYDIDLSEFGQEGIIVMNKPDFRRINQKNNALGKCALNPRSENGNIVTDGYELGDMAIIEVLSYVKKAPFQPTLAGFLKYCDRMDEKDLGSAERLFTEMNKTMALVKEEPSPFAESP